jgi:hypothetical protein
MVDTAAHLVDKVLPRLQRKPTSASGARSGAITFIQRFGSALNRDGLLVKEAEQPDRVLSLRNVVSTIQSQTCLQMNGGCYQILCCRYPPEIAPRTNSGSRPLTISSGSGSSGES